jgi:hypothetical protein
MKARIAALVILAAAPVAGWASTVISEWGGHVLNVDYQVDWDLQHGDYGVRIIANPNPSQAWKFVAFESTDHSQPGDINYINIDSSVPLGEIHVSVIGDPSQVPYPYCGAAMLGSLDLFTNGDSTNSLDEIYISGDTNLGNDPGPIQAPYMGTIWIGGSTHSDLRVSSGATHGAITGSIYVGRDLNEGIAAAYADIVGPIEIGGVAKGEITCQTMGNLTVHGAYDPNAQLQININDATATYRGQMHFDHSTDAVINISGSFGGYVQADEDLYQFWVAGDMGGSTGGYLFVGGDLTGFYVGRMIESGIGIWALNIGSLDIGGSAYHEIRSNFESLPSAHSADDATVQKYRTFARFLLDLGSVLVLESRWVSSSNIGSSEAGANMALYQAGCRGSGATAPTVVSAEV